jgi:hypothetical protein
MGPEIMMAAASILELPDIRFIEPSFADLTDDYFTDVFLDTSGDQGRLLIDEHSDPIAMALYNKGRWVVSSYHLRKPTPALIERFEDTAGDIYQEDRAVWAAAVREYYSLSIVENVTPAIEDLNPERIPKVDSLISEIWGKRTGSVCLDCCCGSGVGSMVLRTRGLLPLSYDIDQALLSRGLHEGRLRPDETMCIDATRAGSYIDRSPLGLGLMFGEIYPFNQDLWQNIVLEFMNITDEALITTGKEEEVRLVASWAGEAGGRINVFENDRDPIYDRWVCTVTH